MAGCAGVSSFRLGIAFACVIGAGLASVIGALLVLFGGAVVKSNFVLPASLSFAAGVMLYISFVDIYVGKAVGHFEEAGYPPATAFTFASLCFLSGFPVSWILDKIAERVVYHGHACGPPHGPLPELPGSEAQASFRSTGLGPDPSSRVAASVGPLDPESLDQDRQGGSPAPKADGSDSDDERRSKRLVHMGLLAALAMGLHNLPEGLVTFVGYMDSIRSGATTAIAIAIHNIPEGMVVAAGVYFGTGCRRRALLWASVSAVAEPLGALIGLAVVCGGSLNNVVFGILFGLVAGIMVYISLKELLPSSRSFDPEDRVSTIWLMLGMAIMACSLVAIGFSQPNEEPVADASAVAGDSPMGGSAGGG